MDKEEQLAEQLRQYQELAKQNPNIDISALMLNALHNSSDPQNFISKKQKRLAYLISIGFPPFGLIFALKFYFSGKNDGKSAGLMCAILTALSILAFVVFFQILLSSSGTSLQQIQNINPQDVQQLYQ